jgi:RNA polymerase sigma-70 factor (ECF subfamily)
MSPSGEIPADGDLVLRLRAGEKQAFVELVRIYHAPMRRVAAAIIGDAQAEESVQEAWLAVIRNLDSFQGRSSLKTWLFTIVGNEAKSRLRKSKREISAEELDIEHLFAPGRFAADGHWARPPVTWHDESPEALLSYEDFQRCLDKTLAGMPALQRAILALRDEEGLDLESICNILGVSASNARVLVHRARTRVHAMVEHFEETGTC